MIHKNYSIASELLLPLENLCLCSTARQVSFMSPKLCRAVHPFRRETASVHITRGRHLKCHVHQQGPLKTNRLMLKAISYPVTHRHYAFGTHPHCSHHLGDVFHANLGHCSACRDKTHILHHFTNYPCSPIVSSLLKSFTDVAMPKHG